jgi:hypothetical protein
LLHELELLIFELHDFLFVALDFMAHRLKLVVLARLVLLRLQPGNAALTRPDVEFQLLAIHLQLARPLFQRFEAGGGGSKLRFEILSLLRQRPYLEPNLPDFLVPILQNQKFFQLRLHSENAID